MLRLYSIRHAIATIMGVRRGWTVGRENKGSSNALSNRAPSSFAASPQGTSSFRVAMVHTLP